MDFLHVDADPRAGEPLPDEQARILAELQQFEPKPTVIIFSGGGYNVLWRCATAVELDGTDQCAVEAERWSRYLQTRFLGADDTHNVDRILRLPGSINWPNSKKLRKGREPALAYIAHADWEACVDLDILPKVAPLNAHAEVTVDVDTSNIQRLDSVEHLRISDRAKAAIVSGPDPDEPLDGDNSRSGWVFYVLCEMARGGCDDDTMFSVITDPSFRISEHVCEQPDTERYALRQIERAKQQITVDGLGTVPFSEDHLADTFVLAHADNLRHCATMGKWFEWDGARWHQDSTLHAFDLCRQIARQAASHLKPDSRLADKLSSAKTVAAMERLAKADRRVAVEVSAFDADPMLLNTPAGVVDLRTGELLPHQPTLYCTRLASVGPAGGPPQLWLEFLDTVTAGDTEFIAYLRRALGYCLTGQTVEHALFFAHGLGGNGKSVFAETVMWLLGEYARSTPFNTLVASSQQQHPTDLADLRGARLVTAPETEANQRWAESKIKMMTGGDRIKARFMRQDFFEYQPQFKLLVVGNHLPGFSNVDDAIRRRVHLLPFNVTIPKERQDKHLKERLQAEGGQILQWAVQGCLEWQQAGLQPPAKVMAATASYLHGQDTVAQWLEDCTETDPAGAPKMADLFESWTDWCRECNEKPMSKRWLGDRLEERGYERASGTGNARIVRGLRFTPGEAGRLLEHREARREDAQARRELLRAAGRTVQVPPVDDVEVPF